MVLRQISNIDCVMDAIHAGKRINLSSLLYACPELEKPIRINFAVSKDARKTAICLALAQFYDNPILALRLMTLNEKASIVQNCGYIFADRPIEDALVFYEAERKRLETRKENGYAPISAELLNERKMGTSGSKYEGLNALPEGRTPGRLERKQMLAEMFDPDILNEDIDEMPDPIVKGDWGEEEKYWR